jgi:hypothetical protein
VADSEVIALAWAFFGEADIMFIEKLHEGF